MTSILKNMLWTAAAALLGLGTANAYAGQLGVYTSDANGFDTHTFYYDDGQEVTLIDAQFVPALTQAMVEQVKKETRSPITRVIVTHPNPDKFNGLAYLHTLGVESISSRAVAEAMPGVHEYKKYYMVNIAKSFTAESYPKFENVKTTFSDATKIKLKSGETLSLIELKNPGVSSKQVVVRIDKTGDLIVGDLVHHHAHAWIEGGIVNGKPRPDLAKWVAALGELPAYLNQANALVDKYLAELGDRKKELADPATSNAHHQELQKRFAAAFPNYRLPYMIGYSVYGLVASKLK